MVNNLNTKLAEWLAEARMEMPGTLEREIENRVLPYPDLAKTLAQTPIDVAAFYRQVKSCTLMTEVNRFAATPLKTFFENEALARQQVSRLVERLPESPRNTPLVIDRTIDITANKTHLQKPLAASLFSIVLTTAHPQRFVDYPSHKVWENFAMRLGYGLSTEDTYGYRMMWAGEFAAQVAQTEVFQLYWSQCPYPMWIVSALCWSNKLLEEKAK